MKTNKNIDRLFQEKLKDFEVSPPDNVWKGIERNLKTSKSKPLFPLWFRIGSAAAIIMLLTLGGVNYFSSEPTDINNDNTIITDSNNENVPKINEEVLNKDILNLSENENVIVATGNDDSILDIDSDGKSTSETNKKLIKKDILNSAIDETLITDIEGPNNKKDVISNKITTDKGEINSIKSHEQNVQNTIADIQLKKATSNLEESNTEIVTNSNSLKQDVSLLNTNKNNLSSNTKNTSNINVTKTTGKVGVKRNNINNDNESTSSQPDQITENITKENINNNLTLSQSNKITENISKGGIIKNSTSSQTDKNVNNIAKIIDAENLIESKDKSLNAKTDSDKVNETKNAIAQVESEKLEPLEDILAKNVEDEEETLEDNKKWSVASVFAPIAYNSFNVKGSPLDLQFENSPKQGSQTMSYGVKVGYKINNRLSLQSGVTMVDLGYKVGDVFVNPSQQGLQKLTNVNYSSPANILNVQAGDILNEVQLETTSSVPIKGVLNQEFGYIEVPLELKYKLNNSKKLGVNLIGGFSTLFLNKNEVFVETSEFSSNLGEANNLNNVNFSGNLGIDVDYKINKNLYLNVAPMLKIHTSTFSKNADNFKPYILGVYTGLNYKF